MTRWLEQPLATFTRVCSRSDPLDLPDPLDLIDQPGPASTRRTR